MALKTRRKASGRCQAAANAAIAPLLLPAMRAVVRIGRQRQAVGLRDVRQQLVEQEPRVVAAHRVVLVAAVDAIERVGRSAPSRARA